MSNSYIPQVDYTSRDYAALREDMLALIPNYAPGWTNRDPADFGMVLVDLFAYMGDLLNYYIDRSANEAFISTASQRDNVLQLANLLSYVPTSRTASTVTLTFENSTGSSITVPALTQVATTTISSATSTQIIFETDEAVVVPAKVGSTNGSATVTATQGVTITSEGPLDPSGNGIGTSDGSVNQTFQLSESPVINNSIDIVINGVSYTQVQYLIDYNNFDAVFSATTNAAGTTFVTFGDNVSGRIPPNGAKIFATYRIGGGVEGNVSTNTIRYVLTNPVSGLSVSNQDVSVSGDGAATGGADSESTDDIRINAPKSVRTLNRAVSLRDYAELCIQVSGVAKAISVADVYTSVTIYFAPFGDKGVQVDGVTPSTVFNTLSTAVLDYLVDRAPANTTVTLQPPSYVPIDLNISITVLPQYKQSLVQSAVEETILSLLDFSNVSFADRITIQDILTAISSVNGVAYANLSKLIRQDELNTHTITNKALASNVATLTTSVAHGFTVGQTVLVENVDATFNGTFVITAVGSTTTFSYSQIATNVTSASATGSATILVVADVVCDTQEIPEIGDLVITASGGITI
jgi:hypothetical protein